jgi:hypothetical protein
MAIIVQGGTVADIANAIALKKMPGAQTFGSTSLVVTDSLGLPITINYFVLTMVPIYFAVTIQALPGYTSTTGTVLMKAITDYVNGLAIGYAVYLDQIIGAAGLIGTALGKTFQITILKQGTAPAPTGTANIAVAYNAAASCSIADISLTVV